MGVKVLFAQKKDPLLREAKRPFFNRYFTIKFFAPRPVSSVNVESGLGWAGDVASCWLPGGASSQLIPGL